MWLDLFLSGVDVFGGPNVFVVLFRFRLLRGGDWLVSREFRFLPGCEGRIVALVKLPKDRLSRSSSSIFRASNNEASRAASSARLLVQRICVSSLSTSSSARLLIWRTFIISLSVSSTRLRLFLAAPTAILSAVNRSGGYGPPDVVGSVGDSLS